MDETERGAAEDASGVPETPTEKEVSVPGGATGRAGATEGDALGEEQPPS
jgi:hypothetical protein